MPNLNFPHPSHVNETNHYRYTGNFVRSNRNLPKNYKSKQNRRNTRNLVTINLKRGPPPTKAIPKCLVINARSLAKPDAPSALYTEMISNNIDICFVSETWLHDNISSELICPNGYGILRNDRSTPRRGGGVAILYKIDWRISDITASETFEYLSCKIKRDNAEYFISALYHPPNPDYQQQELLDYLSGRYEEILITNSSARMIIAGDINQLLIKDFCLQNNLIQLVTKPTRGKKTLDVFITNYPHLWKSPTIFKGLVRSDHMAIVVIHNF